MVLEHWQQGEYDGEPAEYIEEFSLSEILIEIIKSDWEHRFIKYPPEKPLDGYYLTDFDGKYEIMVYKNGTLEFKAAFDTIFDGIAALFKRWAYRHGKNFKVT